MKTKISKNHLNRSPGPFFNPRGRNSFFSKENAPPQSGQYTFIQKQRPHIQQYAGSTPVIQRKNACNEDSSPERAMSACPSGATDVGRRAQGQSNRLDSRAQAIISYAQGSDSAQVKALNIVNRMICAYMPSYAGKVRKFQYKSSESGLHVQSVGSGSSARGDICVGDYFVNYTTRRGISRRLLQLYHELRHIDQYRRGMTGQNKQDQREFLAFHEEALANEFIGTRRMGHATRRGLIDVAIGYYYCLSRRLQTRYDSRLSALLARRRTVDGTRGNASTNPPTSCRRQ